ncbi:MAG: hypothetical protein ACWGQW_01715 [bacterium]
MPGWLRGTIIGLLICLAVGLGLYVGGWVMFIGGIVQIAEAIKSNPVSGIDIAVGAVRIFGASFVGWAVFIAVGFITWIFSAATE